ncbi:glycosyltransferase family 4 protein [Sodalis ligni]|uniref:UDP-glucose:(Heptosyl)LPS alpha-1,3-glucosyltransferase n=1 Tax=Sodalis ligni TaxID=2697027 RepID=A0A4R1NL86_9GAMM|nr:glycosyltransferase family 4 protein [Sodalis ligni]TCL05556.1 UDP-glucose:(heptosyl)LPS alpha-1,3-glucosyltransferase [Sodalis ligni]
MKKIRLAIVRQKYRPDGGAERFISRALEALDSDELELNILTRQWSGEPRPNWHVHICNPAKWGRVSRERGFAEAAKRCWQREQFDLVQSHERIAGCDVFRAGDGVHRVWLEQRARIDTPWQRWLTSMSGYHRYVLAAEEAMFHSSSLKKIICNSAMVMNDIIRCYQVPADKFALIYNAIDSSSFYPSSSEQRQLARERLSLPDEACALIYVGSGFERKGLRQAIAAIAATDRYLVVVGQDKHQPKYLAYANSLGCRQRIRFVGIQKDVLPFYHAADGLILPTLYDPFPNVILEAMACGLPVITSQTCGGAEFIEPGIQGYVCDALDLKTLTELAAAIPLRHRRPDMGLAARERVKECTPARLSSELTELYRQLLED